MQAKQGRAVFGVDMKIVGEDGQELPRDGKASGELMVRGPVDHRRTTSRAKAATRCVRRRLVPDRRRRDDRRRRLHADHRPQQGRDQVGRRMDRLDRPREHRDGASRGGDGRLHRRRAPEVGRAPAAGGGEEARRRGDARRAAARSTRARSPSGGRPTTSVVRRCDPARRDRQDAEEQAARAVRQTTSCRTA